MAIRTTSFVNMSSRVTATQSTLITLAESELKNDEKRVLLKVSCSGREADTTYHYLISRNAPFRELMLDYIRRISACGDHLKFVFNGSDINQNSSANISKLEDGDSIDVIRQPESNLITLPRFRLIADTPITLNLTVSGSDRHLLYLLGRNTPLKILFRHYGCMTSRIYETTRFYYRTKNDLRLLNPERTADDFKMEDGDIICAEPLSPFAVNRLKLEDGGDSIDHVDPDYLEDVFLAKLNHPKKLNARFR